MISLDYESSSSSSEEDSDDEYREIGYKADNIESDEDEEIEDDGEGTSSNTKRSRGKTKGSGHECPHCEKTFKYPNKLREHIRTHESDRYQCFECTTLPKFDNINELRAHQKELHTQASHNCPQCSYTSSRPIDIRRHIQQNHIDGVPCTVSGCFMRVAKNRLKTHLKEMHSTSIDPSPKVMRATVSFKSCPRCEYKPDESILDADDQHTDLMRHVELFHEKKKRPICSFGCGATLVAEESETHWKKCPKMNPDEPSTSTPRLDDDGCRDTNTVTSQSVTTETTTGYPNDSETEYTEGTSPNEIEIEEGIHDSEPPRKQSKTRHRIRGDFKCDLCGNTFTLSANLRRHVRALHSENSKSAKKANINQHQLKCDRKLTVDGDELCGKSFRTEQALTDHFNVHDGLKPYACLTCNQRFHARDRFAVHLSKYHLTSIKVLNANEAQFGERTSVEPDPSLDSATTSSSVQ